MKSINELINKIIVKESEILNMFKDVEIITSRKIAENICYLNKDILQKISDLSLEAGVENKSLEYLVNLIHKRLHNLVHKNYLTPISTNTSNGIEYSFSLLNIFAIGRIIDKELVIRANYDRTKLYYNDSKETKIIELKIKTKANLHKTYFINVNILNYEIKQNKKYKEYTVICLVKPFAHIEVLSDKLDKSFNNISIDNLLKHFYKYYSMKVFINDNKLIKLEKHDNESILYLSINNNTLKNTKITIFVGGVGYEYIHSLECLIEYRNILVQNLCIDEDKDIFIYFNGPECEIHDNFGRVLYFPKNNI